MNQNPQSDPQRMPSPPGGGGNGNGNGNGGGGGGDDYDRMPQQHRYRRSAVKRMPRPWFYCGCLTFVALIVLVIVLVVRGQPASQSISTIQHAVPLKIQAKHAHMQAAAIAPRVNTELRFAKVKRNEPSAEKSKTKSQNGGVVGAVGAEEGAVADAEPAPKKDPKAAPHHFYHDAKKHGKKD